MKTKEEIEKMAEIEYPYDYKGFSLKREGYIKGFLACQQQQSEQPPSQDKWDKINDKFDKAIKEEFDQSDAVEFAEWVDSEGYAQTVCGQWHNVRDYKIPEDKMFTTSELYQIFRNGNI